MLHPKKSSPLKMPPVLGEWRFNDAASPIRDGHGGRNNLTVSGGSFSANGTTVDQSSGAYWVDAGSVPIIGEDKFMVFVEFTPNTTAGDSDYIACGSGTGFNPIDYTWYSAMAPTTDGYYFGVVPTDSGSYGAGVAVTTGAVPTGVKHYAMFGYQRRAGTAQNRGFLYMRRDGDAQIFTATSSTLDDIKYTSTHKMGSRGDLTGTSFSATYGHMVYMRHFYSESKALFDRLVKRAKTGT